MSLHYILDGYNIVRQAEHLFGSGLKDVRVQLVNFINENKPCGSSNNKVTVVFDGRAGISYLHDKGPVEVIFSQDESADERIKRMVESLHNPKQAVVVSDDRDIQISIRGAGARSMPVAEFLEKGQPNLKAIKGHPKAELSSSQVARINEELKKLWL